MKILIFTEGTILMHNGAVGFTRKEIVQQIKDKEETIHNYASYVPIGCAISKVQAWHRAGHNISYLTSRRNVAEVDAIQNIIEKHGFPPGQLYYRKGKESYSDVAERVMPDILIEDDCESIGGVAEMTYTHIDPIKKRQIQSIAVPEFGGIDHVELPLYQ